MIFHKKNQLVCARRPAHLRMQTNFSNSKYFSKIAIIKSLTITNYSFIKSITTTRKNHSHINPSHIYTYIVIYTHIFEKKNQASVSHAAARQIWPRRAAARRAGPRLPPDLATPGRHPPGLAAPPAGAGHARPGRTSRQS